MIFSDDEDKYANKICISVGNISQNKQEQERSNRKKHNNKKLKYEKQKKNAELSRKQLEIKEEKKRVAFWQNMGSNKIVKSAIFENIEQEYDLNEFIKKSFEQSSQYIFKQKKTLSKEPDEGSVEYKWKLTKPSQERLEHLTTQMNFRLNEGHGEAIYEIGFEDNGNPLGLNQQQLQDSLETLCAMASEMKADVVILCLRQGHNGIVAEVLVRRMQRNQREDIKLDLKIMLLGDKSTGKSTLIEVLTSGVMDNGRGSARNKILKHQHEILNQETSSLSHYLLGFDSSGKITNHRGGAWQEELFQESVSDATQGITKVQQQQQYQNIGQSQNQRHQQIDSWEEIVDSSSKILTLIDLGGSEKFAKTIINSFCNQHPEYIIMMISAELGVTAVSEQHFKLAAVFVKPIIVCITKIDTVTQDQLTRTVSQVRQCIKQNFQDKIPICVKDMQDVVLLSRLLHKEAPIPLFLLSSVTGQGLNLFQNFLNLLPLTNQFNDSLHLKTEFYIQQKFIVQNKLILAGTVIKGSVNKYSILMLGPIGPKGEFAKVSVKEIRCFRVGVRSAQCGQTCTIQVDLSSAAMKLMDNNKWEVRKGLVLIDDKNPRASLEFLAEIWLFDNDVISQKILRSQQMLLVNSSTARQACKLIFYDQDTSNKENDQCKQMKSQINKLQHIKSQSIDNLQQEKTDKQLQINQKKTKKFKFSDYSTQHQHKNIDGVQQQHDIIQEEKNCNQLELIKQRCKSFHTIKDADQLDQKSQIQNGNNNNSVGDVTFNITYEDKKRPRKQSMQNNEKEKCYVVKPNQKNYIRLRFKYYPEYIHPNQKIIINDSCIKAFGWIKEIYY